MDKHSDKKPNILLILCDQLRYDCVGAAKKYNIKTPNMDSLAEEGIFFENAFTPLPVCAPARQAIVSGVQPDSIGALFNYNFIPTAGASVKNPSWITNLKNDGYKLGFAGKWDASPYCSPVDFGYEICADMGEYGRFINEKYGNINYHGGWFGCPHPVEIPDDKPHWIMSKACEFIERSKDEPWHMWIDIPDPHLPCRPSKPFDTMYSPDDMTPWDSFGDTHENKPYIHSKQIESWHLENLEWKDFAPCVARYFGVVSQIDHALGTVIEKLKETNQLEDTLIILTSDHGDTCGGHGMLDKHYILFDDVTHVPMILRYPKALGSGRCKNFVSSALDIAPTVEEICSLSGSEYKHHGYSLTNAVNNKNAREFSVSTSNGQQFGLFTNRCIRNRRFKYIWNLTDIDEFYDLEKDPGELINEIDNIEYAEIIAEMKPKLFDELTRLNDPFANGWLSYQLGK